MLKFKNVPDYAYNHKYMVFRRSEEDWYTLYFWSAWNDAYTADEEADKIKGETWLTYSVIKWIERENA